jgi:hypothetical protein
MTCPLYGCKYINTIPVQDFDVGVSIEKARFKTGSGILFNIFKTLGTIELRNSYWCLMQKNNMPSNRKVNRDLLFSLQVNKSKHILTCFCYRGRDRMVVGFTTTCVIST